MPAPIAAAGAPRRVLATPPAHALAEPAMANAMQIPSVPPIDGALREVDDLIRHRNFGAALAQARAWREQEPGDVLALVALGECARGARAIARSRRARLRLDHRSLPRRAPTCAASPASASSASATPAR